MLSRLQDFLPKIKDANDQLDMIVKQDPKSVDIENVDEESGEQYIEMDLGLGVFDMKKDVTEEDIIINPKSNKPDEAAAKPTIVMMDLDKDVTKHEEGEGDHRGDDESDNDKIPSAATDKDHDVVMSS